MIRSENPCLRAGEREDRETRIGIDSGFFLWTPEKWLKKAHRNKRGGFKSILWEGGGDKEDYADAPGWKEIVISNNKYTVYE
jgi:hypothetical protein